MKHLLPINTTQIINIIPRVYSTAVVLKLRDDSTNDQVTFTLPTAELNGNYIRLSAIFSLVEGHFYDLKVYEVKGSYKEFKERVIAASGTFENNSCLLTFLEVENLVNTTDLDIIYRDKIFCTAQSTDQTSGNKYSVNKDEYVTKSANNDFIII
jgi:hypothetical protein